MTRVLLDINVVLDVLLERRSHVEASAAVWRMIETGRSEGLLSAHAFTTIYYLVRQEAGTGQAKRMTAALLKVFTVAPVNDSVLREALELPLTDFEDSVTCAAARLAGCDYIVTRDPKGFRGSPVQCLPPEAIVPILGREKL